MTTDDTEQRPQDILRTHTSGRPFEYKEDGSDFAAKSNDKLKTLMRTHTARTYDLT